MKNDVNTNVSSIHVPTALLFDTGGLRPLEKSIPNDYQPYNDAEDPTDASFPFMRWKRTASGDSGTFSDDC